MLDLNKFLPLNTLGQVDALISHLKEYPAYQLESVEGEILMEIRKVKLQFYFKEQFNLIARSKPVLRPKRFPKVFVKELDTLEGLKELKGSFAGYRMDEVAKELGKPVAQLIRFLAKQKMKARADTVLDEKANIIFRKSNQMMLIGNFMG